MRIERGATYALTGHNGSGKSVLLKLICGFMTPDSGEVWVDPAYLSPRRTFP
ncbi:MAG: ATP-binding cassette domain-containing protein, partial [Microbacterium sp.]|nr:ATP-binding cassette domain-containing protein [Microbacterium sp.]